MSILEELIRTRLLWSYLRVIYTLRDNQLRILLLEQAESIGLAIFSCGSFMATHDPQRFLFIG